MQRALLSEADKVFAWRLAVLERAGYPVEEAEALALDAHVDLHMAVELLAGGCAVATAMEILR